MSERVIFHVDMNAFFAAVEQQCHPQLRGKPIVICGNPNTRTVVAACSYEAKAYGIKNGMSVGEAKRLCPWLIPVGGHPEKYVDISRRLFDVMHIFTPQVEIFSIDEAFMDVTKTYRFFAETPEDIAHQIKQRIREGFGLTCSIGIGPNKLIAKIASKLKKPDGLTRVRETEVSDFMEHLPIEAVCGIGPRLTYHLNEWGVMTCGDLGRTQQARLTARFGIIGYHLKRMGFGLDDSDVLPFISNDQVKSMGHSYTMPRDTAQPSVIQGVMLRLSEKIAYRLRSDGYQGREIQLTIRYKDFSGMSFHRRLHHFTDNGLTIFRTGWQLFESRCEPITQRVRLIGISVASLSHYSRQLSLLEEDQRMERLDRCMDFVNNRFGSSSVVRASALKPLVTKSHGFMLRHRQRSNNLILQ